jgi:hypothetical protein
MRRGAPGDRRASLSVVVDFDQAPIRNIFVPHTGQVPSVAGFPFFMVILFSFRISRFALHLTQ